MSTSLPPDNRVQLLKWDTEFWGKQVGRASPPVATADQAAEELNIDLLMMLVPIDLHREHRHAVERGFTMVDVRVEFGIKPTGWLHDYCRPYNDTDLPAILEIARDAFKTTRFYADRHLADTRCDDMYASWATEMCADPDTIVMVAEAQDRVAGFVTLRPQGDIGLIAVHENARGLGVGTDLMHSAMKAAYNSGIDELLAVTQGGNLPAQRLFQSVGGMSLNVALWWHKWYQR